VCNLNILFYFLKMLLSADEFQLEIRFVFASQNHLNNHLGFEELGLSAKVERRFCLLGFFPFFSV
jgi:hypothetical protein